MYFKSYSYFQYQHYIIAQTCDLPCGLSPIHRSTWTAHRHPNEPERSGGAERTLTTIDCILSVMTRNWRQTGTVCDHLVNQYCATSEASQHPTTLPTTTGFEQVWQQKPSRSSPHTRKQSSSTVTVLLYCPWLRFRGVTPDGLIVKLVPPFR